MMGMLLTLQVEIALHRPSVFGQRMGMPWSRFIWAIRVAIRRVRYPGKKFRREIVTADPKARR